MITENLKQANQTLEKLISITAQDMIDIKAAKHEAIFSRTAEKESLAAIFEKQKSELDGAIAKAAAQNPELDLAALLSEGDRELLNSLRESLAALHKQNKKFASLALSIGEFYGSLLKAVFPSEQVGYGAATLSSAKLLQARG